ncbi:MAG: DNRLRE domain-containing protein [Planctomycetaceae bacterium]
MNQWAGWTMGIRRCNRRSFRREPLRDIRGQQVTEVLESRCLLSAATVQLLANHDTTIYNILPSDVSNGHGQFIVAGGATGAAATRRGLVSFDLSSAGIPFGSTILDAVLTMNLAETIGGAAEVSMHRVTKAWGEAASDAPGNEFDGATAQQFDATWHFSMFDGAAWANAGGDFAGASAVVSVDALGTYEWTSEDLIADVQTWLDDSSLNFGWLIHGSETVENVKAFNSRDSPNPALRPALEITYEEPVLPSIVEGRKFFDRNGDGILLSATVAALQLSFDHGESYYNCFGGREYWYRSQSNNSWYFLTPSGELVEWVGRGNRLTGQTIESLDPHVWFKPHVLISAGPAEAEPWLNGFEFELVDAFGNVVARTTSRDVDRNGDGIIQDDAERGWFRFENVAPGMFTVREVPQSGWVQSASASSPLAAEMYALDSSLDLRFTGRYFENDGGRGERWLWAAGGQWYFVTPIGDLYKWDGVPAAAGRPAGGTIVATPGAAYYNDPSLIWAAGNPNLTVSAGTVVYAGEIGNFQPAVISGRKWYDRNPDGVRNSAVYEPSLPILLDPTAVTIPGSGSAPTYLVWVADAATGTLTQVTYVLNPSTRLTHYTTNSSSSSGTTIVGSVPGILGSDPAAIAAWLYADEPWLNGWTFELLNDQGFVVATSVTMDRDLNQNLTIEPEQERGWYMFEGLLPGNYTIREVPQAGWIQVSPAPLPLQQTLADLQAQFGFHAASNDGYNFGGQHECWLLSRTNTWYYLTPAGGLYEWDRNSGGTHGSLRGTRVAQLSGSVYANPNLLFAPSGSSLTVESGSVITDRHFGNHQLLDGVFSSLSELLE